MDIKVAFIARRFSSLSFTFGSICVILSFLLTISPIPTGAAGESNSPLNQSNPGNCGPDGGFKVDLPQGSTGYTYNSDQIITSVVIKAGSEQQGQACFTFTSDGSDGCYAVSGLGTNSVTVTEVGVGSSPDCKDISHIEFYTNPPPVDTPTPTPTGTATKTVTPPAEIPTATPTGTATEFVPPADTPTPTPTGTATEFVPPPIDTPTPTPTGTATEFVPPPIDTPTPTPTGTVTEMVPPPADTPTPTSTGTATETAPPQLNTPTVTPTSTGTDIVNPPVPSPTSTGSALPPGPTVTPTPTGTGLPPESNPPTPTDIVMPPAQTEVPGTLPPPSAPEPRFKQPELVPVTGSNRLMIGTSNSTLPQEFFLNVGLGLLGLSIVFYGISKKLQ